MMVTETPDESEKRSNATSNTGNTEKNINSSVTTTAMNGHTRNYQQHFPGQQQQQHHQYQQQQYRFQTQYPYPKPMTATMAMPPRHFVQQVRPGGGGGYPPYLSQPPRPYYTNATQPLTFNIHSTYGPQKYVQNSFPPQPLQQAQPAQSSSHPNGNNAVATSNKTKIQTDEKPKDVVKHAKEIQELKNTHAKEKAKYEKQLSDAMKKAESLEREVRKQARDIAKLNSDIKAYKEKLQVKNETSALVASLGVKTKEKYRKSNECKINAASASLSSPSPEGQKVAQWQIENLQSSLEEEISKRKGEENRHRTQVEKLKKTHKEQLEKMKKKAAERLEQAKSKSKEVLEKEKTKRKTLEAQVLPSIRKKARIAAASASTPTSAGDGDGDSDGEKAIRITPQKKYPLGNKWMMRFERLKRFKEEFGHCDVPTSYGKPKNPQDATPDDEEKRKLFHFVQSQRTCHRKMRQGRVDHSITPQKIQMLEEIGFKWDVGVTQLPWEERYKQLIRFKEEHGHCEVSTTFKRKGFEGFSSWVLMQRRRYRDGSLAEEKIKKLEKLGFKWSLRDRGGTLEERMVRNGVIRRGIVTNGNDDRNQCDVVDGLNLISPLRNNGKSLL